MMEDVLSPPDDSDDTDDSDDVEPFGWLPGAAPSGATIGMATGNLASGVTLFHQ